MRVRATDRVGALWLRPKATGGAMSNVSEAGRRTLAELMQDPEFARAMRAAPKPTLRRVKDRFTPSDYQELLNLGRTVLDVLDDLKDADRAVRQEAEGGASDDPAGVPETPAGATPIAGDPAGTPPRSGEPRRLDACCVRYPIRGLVQFVGHTTMPVGGITVELWEQGASATTPRATTVTDAGGRFDVVLDDRALTTSSPTIRFRVLYGGAYVVPDPSAVWTVSAPTAFVRLTVAGTRIEGYVRQADGVPVASSVVKAFASQMRTEDLLGTATTDATGHYAIECTYAADKLDVIVRAYASGGTPELAHSDLLPDVGQFANVDLVVCNLALAGKAEFTTIMEAIDGARGAVLAKNLTAADVAQVAAKYRVPADRVQLAVDAQVAVQPGTSAELFYALGYATGRVTVSSALSSSAADRQAAVDLAIAQNRVTRAFAANSAAELAALAGLVTGLLLTDGSTALPTRLDMILRIGGMTVAANRTTLLNAYTAYAGTPDQFWVDAPTLTGLSGTLLADVRAALHIGIYTLNHPPMVQSLWSSGIRTAKALGSLTTADWSARIASSVTLPGAAGPAVVGSPNEIVGANDAAKAVNYAAALTTVNARVFPSNAFRTAYAATPIASTTPLATFLAANPNFDFVQQSIYAYVRANPTAFSGNPGGLAQVEKVARLFKIAPETTRYTTAKSLWDAGFDSARSVYLFGKESFVAKMTAAPYSLSIDTAEQVFDKSAHLAAVASTIAFTFGAPFQPPGEGGAITIQSASSSTLTEVPDFTTLFGSLDYCACDECASVYGPAAYLTDILHFLEQRKSTNPLVSALAVLEARRPDLTTTELTCTNTNTVVPYIDLLNEQLELRVSPATPSYQTTWTEPELAIHPEHLRPEAYDVLKGKVYPFTQPYNLWVDESRSYIGLKSVSRSELRAATLADPPSDSAWVTEVLGMTDLQRQVIQGSGSLVSALLPNDYWGMSPGATWFTSLSSVPTIMKRSGLTFDDLSAEIATTYVSSAQSPPVAVDLAAGCDLQTATLSNVTSTSEPFFTRLHRFDRLRRALGWTIHQTDRAIQTLGGTQLDAGTPTELAGAMEIVRRTHAPVDDVLSWRNSALIDTTPDPKTGISPFEAMFPRRNVATGDETFALAGSRTKLAIEESSAVLPLLVDNLTAIAAGLGSDVASLQAILAAIFDAPSIATKPLTLQNISRLHRYVTLARANGLSVPDLLALIELDGLWPFDVALYRLPLTGWWRASYSGAPWLGTASAGTSGAHSVSNAGSGTTDVAAGPNVNGLAPAHFGTTTKYLRDAASGIGAYISPTGYRVAALVNVGSGIAGPAGPSLDAAIIADGGNAAWGIAVNSKEVILYHFRTITHITVSHPMTPGWHVVDASYDGSTIRLSVDGSPAVQATVGPLTNYSTGDPLVIGAGPAGTKQFVGDIAELIVCDQPLATVSPEAMKAYFEARYGLDLSWSPKKNIPDTTLFLRADLGLTLSNGKVATWVDQSGVGDANRNANQSIVAARPGFQSSNPRFRGYPTIDCTMDGAQERYLRTGVWGAPTLSGEVTIAIVCRRANSSINNRYLFDSLSGNQFALYQDNTGSTHYAYNTGIGSYAYRNADLLSPSAVILSAKNGSGSALRVNSNSNNATVSGNPGAFSPTGFTIGCYLGAGPYSDFEIAEICVWWRQLTPVEIAALNAYFGARYGLAIAP